MRKASDEALEAELKRELSLRGDFTWFLDCNQDTQVAKLRAWAKRHGPRIVVNAARQTGKTAMVVAWVLETCFARAGVRVLWCAQTGKQVRKVVNTAIKRLIRWLPEALQPRFHHEDSEWRFANGSVLTCVGVNNKGYEDIRGDNADVVVADEVGFWDDCEYVIRAVLSPMLRTSRGPLLITSTPPLAGAAHPFVGFARKAQAQGLYIHWTIDDCPRLTPRDRERAIEDAGGPDSPDNKRENYADLEVVAQDRAVIPEFTDALKSLVVRPWPMPEYRLFYAGIDPGGNRDPTGLVYGYRDFLNGKTVICGERKLKRATTRQIAEAIQEDERRLWKDAPNHDPEAHKQAEARYCDVDPRLLADLWTEYKIGGHQTAKDNKEIALAALRTSFQRLEIVIDPSCVELIFQLQTTIWDEKRKQYERIGGDHGDLLDALLYLHRNVNKNKNPFPDWYRVKNVNGVMVPVPAKPSPAAALNQAMFSKTKVTKRFLKGSHGKRAQHGLLR